MALTDHLVACIQITIMIEVFGRLAFLNKTHKFFNCTIESPVLPYLETNTP